MFFSLNKTFKKERKVLYNDDKTVTIFNIKDPFTPDINMYCHAHGC